MRVEPLSLAGPRQRVIAGVEALRSGKILISGEDSRTARLINATADELEGNGFDLVTMRSEHTFQHAANVLNVETVADPSRLLRSPHLNQTVLRIDCKATTWRDWGKLFLSKLVSAQLAQSLKLWLVWPDSVTRPNHRSLTSHDWNGCLTPSDARIFAADRFRDRPGPGPTQYWEALAVELAGPDLDLIERMAKVREPIYDPIQWLAAEGGAPAPNESYDGLAFFESSIQLARRAAQDQRAAETLNRRIWMAQVRALFVAMESERPSVLAPYKRELERSYQQNPAKDYEQVEVIPRDVEWGSAHWRLWRDNSVPATIRQLLEVARDARNHLAHGEAMGADLMQNLLSVCGAVLKGRWSVR